MVLRDWENYQLRLCGFSDASTQAYAVVIYLQCGREKRVLLTSKTRVAPLNGATVPDWNYWEPYYFRD